MSGHHAQHRGGSAAPSAPTHTLTHGHTHTQTYTQDGHPRPPHHPTLASASLTAEAASSSLSPLQSPRLPGNRAARQRVHVPAAYSDAYYSPPVVLPQSREGARGHYRQRRMADLGVDADTDVVNGDGAPGSSWVAAAGKHLLRRLTRAAKGANWPVVIAFGSCLIILLRALTGTGYMPPSSPNTLSPADTLSPGETALLSHLLPAPPSKGWTQAWDVWRQLAEDLRRQMLEDREKWVGRVRPERERGRGRIGASTAGAGGVDGHGAQGEDNVLMLDMDGDGVAEVELPPEVLEELGLEFLAEQALPEGLEPVDEEPRDQEGYAAGEARKELAGEELGGVGPEPELGVESGLLPLEDELEPSPPEPRATEHAEDRAALGLGDAQPAEPAQAELEGGRGLAEPQEGDADDMELYSEPDTVHSTLPPSEEEEAAERAERLLGGDGVAVGVGPEAASRLDETEDEGEEENEGEEHEQQQ
ncbi:hypothetical protein CALCODRAFT_508568 [Calocera cornea HHB12733]|uniref:Uncharacterized protein n=1 Tax=Calocera cornea HHB12733 TaxID=1353952 RepID=A0A165G7X5_9BASI|nr:hypothetical protein CALCODRAFT_508568 [Calocera cornea HHB12733]